MEKYGFFNAVATADGKYDRSYLAEDFAGYFSSFIVNGVFKELGNKLEVTINSGMSIKVKSGVAWVNGYRYENDNDLTFTLENADGTLSRIDSVVIRLDFTNREIKIHVKKGSLSTSPIAPAITRNNNIYELQLATVRVDANTAVLTQSMITDERADKNVCGWVTAIGSQQTLLDEIQSLQQMVSSLQNTISTMNSAMKWSAWNTCGKNGCNVELWYRYNESLQLVELRWDGTVNATITNGSMGYMWEGFPTDKSPKDNTFIPIQTQSSDLTLRFYPVTSDITANHWTLTAMHGTVSTAYVCGRFIYSYKDAD